MKFLIIFILIILSCEKNVNGEIDIIKQIEFDFLSEIDEDLNQFRLDLIKNNEFLNVYNLDNENSFKEVKLSEKFVNKFNTNSDRYIHISISDIIIGEQNNNKLAYLYFKYEVEPKDNTMSSYGIGYLYLLKKMNNKWKIEIKDKKESSG